MQTNPQGKWGLRLATLCVWALAAASVAYWGLLVSSPAAGSVAAMVPSAAAASIDPARLARLLGAVDGRVVVAPVAAVASRFALNGVVAHASGTGAALIAVDGKPAKAYRVGASVDTGYVLQSVGPRQAILAASMEAPPAVTLEMVSRLAGAAPSGAAPMRFVPPPQPVQRPLAPPTAVPNAPGMSPAGTPAHSLNGQRRM